MKLENKVALVTGGSRGIGKAVAAAFAREGARLALCARTATELQQTIADLRSMKAQAEGWTCDVTMEASVNEFVHEAQRTFGRIDILVNNAGVMTRPAPMVELEVRKWDYTIAVNLRGPFLVTQAVLPFMLQQKSDCDYQCFVDDWPRRVREFRRLCDLEMGFGRIQPNSRRRAECEPDPGEFRGPGYVATKLTGYRGSKPESVTEVFVYLASDESKAVTGKMLSSATWRSPTQ
jgi:NAD(P)-dependent dehydrogenase (short-subunit alcohol dehydrogenase family)